MKPPYDPQKAHDYYEKHKHLKGRHPGAATAATLKRVGGTPVGKTGAPSAKQKKAAAQQRAVRLTQKLTSLNKALQEATEELRIKRAAAQRSRATAKKTAKKNSDGKTTAKERQQSKEYRKKHKAQLAAKAKKAKSGGGSTPKKHVKDMTIHELTTRVSKIKSLISEAKSQLKAANSLSHSLSVNETENHLIHDGVKGR
jgi:hypothetical protein